MSTPQAQANQETFFGYLNQYITLAEDEEIMVASKLKHRSYLKGQYIVQAGDVCKYQTYIVSGKARSFYLDHKGNEHIILFAIENWWIGDLESFINQTPANFNVQCLENVKVIQLAHAELEQLYNELPKMERFFRIVTQRAYASMSKRIVRNYALSARERYILFCEEYPQIAQRVPQYMIASYLGITKEFLSNIRNQIAKEQKS